MNKFIGFLIINSICSPAFSAFDGLTHHSRANCAGFNESVTWWFNHPIIARVESRHYPECLLGKDRNMHKINTGKSNSWRHAAYHPTESYGGAYCVVGNHYMYKKGVEHLVQSESVINCSIYDGWWDK